MASTTPTTTMAATQAAAAATAAVADAKVNHLVAAQLTKTKICAMFKRGACRDSQCRFAHSQNELRSPPDLTKTSMCRAFARGRCRDPTCKFAHGEKELRVTPSVYKTQICHYFQQGNCKKGDFCRHAHRAEELRYFELGSEDDAALSSEGQVSPMSTPARGPADGQVQLLLPQPMEFAMPTKEQQQGPPDLTKTPPFRPKKQAASSRKGSAGGAGNHGNRGSQLPPGLRTPITPEKVTEGKNHLLLGSPLKIKLPGDSQLSSEVPPLPAFPTYLTHAGGPAPAGFQDFLEAALAARQHTEASSAAARGAQFSAFAAAASRLAAATTAPMSKGQRGLCGAETGLGFDAKQPLPWACPPFAAPFAVGAPYSPGLLLPSAAMDNYGMQDMAAPLPAGPIQSGADLGGFPSSSSTWVL